MSLLTTIAEVKKYITIDANAKMATLKPFIEEAELQFMVPLLGQAFYDQYKALYEASVAQTPTPLSADNAALLPYIQRPLAYYMQLLSLPQLSVTYGDKGIRVHRDDNSDSASRWQMEKLQMNALKSGDLYADKLLEFLETNASPTKYATWYADAVANTRMSGAIVYGTTVASKHIAIHNSRRVFLQLKNAIREIETRLVPRWIGRDQYDELVVQLKTGSVSNANRALLDKLEPIIAKRALFLRLPFMRVQINENGVLLYSGTDELVKHLASDADIKALRQQLQDEELGFIADEHELDAFIKDNIDAYPLIKASPVHTVQPDPGPTFVPRNNADNKHFIV